MPTPDQLDIDLGEAPGNLGDFSILDVESGATTEIPGEPGFASMPSASEVVDAIIVPDSAGQSAGQPNLPPEPERQSRRSLTRGSDGGTGKSRTTSGPREAKTGPPSIDEWQRFFGNILLRALTDFYVNRAFHGIDEDLLTDREIERITLSDDERNEIAVPFAELSNKSKFMRKHGRLIVSSGDSINSIIILGMWMNRVNRIAAKYRPQKQAKGSNANGSQRSNQATSNGVSPLFGTSGGQFPPGFTGSVSPSGTG